MALTLSMTSRISSNELDIFVKMIEESEQVRSVIWTFTLPNGVYPTRGQLQGETVLRKGETELASVSIPLSTAQRVQITAAVLEVRLKDDRTGIEPLIGYVTQDFSTLLRSAT